MKTLSHKYTDDNPYASYQSPKQQMRTYKKIFDRQVKEKFERIEKIDTIVTAVVGTICTVAFSFMLFAIYML